MGIDLPIFDLFVLQDKNPNFTKEDYLQMSGRARRGKDTKGNGLNNIRDYKDLMLGELPEIKFQEKELSKSYNYLKKLNKKINLSSEYKRIQ